MAPRATDVSVSGAAPWSGGGPRQDPMTGSRAAFFAALRSAPPGGITPASLAKASGAGETWIRSALGVLCGNGAAVAMPGRLYAPVPGADLAAVYAGVLAAADTKVRALLLEAGDLRCSAP